MLHRSPETSCLPHVSVQWVGRFTLFARAAGALVGVLGLVVLLGWATGSAALKSVLPGLATMKPNTALGLVLHGLALLLLTWPAPSRRVRLWCCGAAVVPLLVGLMTLVEYASGADLVVNRLLFPRSLIPPDGGRMSIPTTVSFVALGTGYVLVTWRRAERALQIAALFVALIAVMGLVGYGYATKFYTFGPAWSFALHTAMAFLLVSSGILAARSARGLVAVLVDDTLGGLVARRLLPVAVLVPAVLGWLRLVGEREELYPPAVGTALFATLIIAALAAVILWVARSLAHAEVQRHQAEKQVLLQAAALEAAANAIAITDARATILWVNQAFCQLTGYARAEALGQTPSLLKSGRHEAAFYQELWATIRQGQVWHGEMVNRRKDGTEYVEEMTIAPLLDDQGAIVNFIAIKQDISRRKSEQEALAAAKGAAEEAARAKDHFLAVLSHELRTPLTPVVTTVALLQGQADLDPSTREGLEMIRRNVELEARLVDDLLDVTRIARGKITLDRAPVDLRAIIARAVEVVQSDLNAQRLHLRVAVPDEPCFVAGDATRLQQVFWNLLRNAIKFTPSAGCVGVSCRTDAGHVVVEVHDSGIGLEPESLTRIFNAFEQAEQAITRQFGGLGLGLTISKALVDLHGGTIEAWSAGKGQGATFRVRLPLIAPPPAPRPPLQPPAAATASLAILLVEDHADTARVMRQLLTREGHRVEHAGDVATALDLVHRHRFDLILSDLGLPDRSGLEFLRELRAQGSHIPAIALSGYGQEDDIRRCHEAGFAAHLTKPTSPERLAQTIAAVIGGGAPPSG